MVCLEVTVIASALVYVGTVITAGVRIDWDDHEDRNETVQLFYTLWTVFAIPTLIGFFLNDASWVICCGCLSMTLAGPASVFGLVLLATDLVDEDDSQTRTIIITGAVAYWVLIASMWRGYYAVKADELHTLEMQRGYGAV